MNSDLKWLAIYDENMNDKEFIKNINFYMTLDDSNNFELQSYKNKLPIKIQYKLELKKYAGLEYLTLNNNYYETTYGVMYLVSSRVLKNFQFYMKMKLKNHEIMSQKLGYKDGIEITSFYVKYSELSQGAVESSSELISVLRKEVKNNYNELSNNDVDLYISKLLNIHAKEDKLFIEGAKVEVTQNIYERNSDARRECIERLGLSCKICGYNFEEHFGDLGKGLIHIHHKVPISQIGTEYKIDPINDLIPVCPNCHLFIHSKHEGGIYSVDEVRNILINKGKL